MSLLLERLRNHKDNRGMMANLRCSLIDSKKHRAWPALNRLGVEIDNDISVLIAALFATHPEETAVGSLGNTCKAIEHSRGDHGDDNKLTSTERRFQHLLSAERGEELNSRILRVVLMARSQGVPVNYTRLEIDLKYWNDRTKTDWARAFWAQGAEEVI